MISFVTAVHRSRASKAALTRSYVDLVAVTLVGVCGGRGLRRLRLRTTGSGRLPRRPADNDLTIRPVAALRKKPNAEGQEYTDERERGEADSAYLTQ